MFRDGTICVVCAENQSGIGEHVLQLITKARELYKCGGGEVVAIYVGGDKEIEMEALLTYGAHKVIVCREKPKNRYEFADAAVRMLSVCQPGLIMFPASDWGETSAAEAAIRLGAGLTANCMDVSMDNIGYIFTRAAINGTVFAKIAAYHTPITICTVQRNAFGKQKLLSEEKKDGLIQISDIKFPLVIDDIEILQSKLIQDLSRVETLDHAKVVFGFGRGLGDGESLQLLYRVANKYQAEVVGTRAVFEKKLIEKNRQVGQSGISISPAVYVAFGISGASQHMVGIMNSRRIISVNKDPDAPITAFANEVIVEDCKTVLKKLDEL